MLGKVSLITAGRALGALSIVFAATAAGAAGLKLGAPSYGGNGCPAGTASVTVSPDETAVSILFDQFLTEAGGVTGRTLDRKSCNLTLPVSVPNGYSVAVFQVDYRGFNAVPSGGYNRFESEYFWAGARGPKITRQFSGPLTDSFTLTDNLITSAVVWSPCGQSVNLRVNASMLSKTNRYQDDVLGSVDSADISSGLIYHLQFRRCR